MSPYGNVEISQLVTMLIEARNIEEQVDILHFLVVSHGLDYKIHVKQVQNLTAVVVSSVKMVVASS